MSTQRAILTTIPGKVGHGRYLNLHHIPKHGECLEISGSATRVISLKEGRALRSRASVGSVRLLGGLRHGFTCIALVVY